MSGGRVSSKGRWKYAVLAAALWLGAGAAWAAAAPGQRGLLPQEQPPASQPVPLLHARQLNDRVQYSLTVALPAGQDWGELRVMLALPPASEVLDVLEAQPETQFLGTGERTLTWRAVAPANSFIGPFSATVGGDMATGAEARVLWSGPPAGEVRAHVSSAPAVTSSEAPLVLRPESDAALQHLGATGILASVPEGAVGNPTTWSVRVLGPETTPADAVAPDTWWCAAVELRGDDPLLSPIVLLLPTRQPLTPGVAVAVFRRGDDGSWERVSQDGVSTPDGLSVAIPVGAPGVYAAGTPARFRQTALGGQASFQSLPVGGAAGGSSAIPGGSLSGLEGGSVGGPAPRSLGESRPFGVSAGADTQGGFADSGAANSQFASPRAATSSCGGFGICAFGGASPASAACSPDASVCVTAGAGPPPFTTVCATQNLGVLRFCSIQ